MTSIGVTRQADGESSAMIFALTASPPTEPEYGSISIVKDKVELASRAASRQEEQPRPMPQ